jgi:hypothetical protein
VAQISVNASAIEWSVENGVKLIRAEREAFVSLGGLVGQA